MFSRVKVSLSLLDSAGGEVASVEAEDENTAMFSSAMTSISSKVQNLRLCEKSRKECRRKVLGFVVAPRFITDTRITRSSIK